MGDGMNAGGEGMSMPAFSTPDGAHGKMLVSCLAGICRHERQAYDALNTTSFWIPVSENAVGSFCRSLAW